MTCFRRILNMRWPALAIIYIGINAFSYADTGARMVDLAITGALILDGSGQLSYVGDILVKDDEIVFVGDSRSLEFQASKMISATGKIVVPGFIDLHAHGNPLLDDMSSFLLQGITTVVLGQDGRSPFLESSQRNAPGIREWQEDIASPYDAAKSPASLQSWLSAVEENGSLVNVASLSGFGTNRLIAGIGEKITPAADELQMAERILLADLEAGAFGMSTGLEYVPDRFSQTQELLSLARTVGKFNGIIFSHLRSEDDNEIAKAIEELVAQGEFAQVHISHLKIVYGRDQEQAEEVLRQIREARRQGIRITSDVYPYLAGSADLGLVYPSWAKSEEQWSHARANRREELREALRARIIKRNGPEAVLIISGEFAGHTLLQVATQLEMPFEEVVMDYFPYGGPSAAHFVMTEVVQRQFITASDVAIATDGGPFIMHPRSWGSYPKVLDEYVFSSGLISPETAIYKMTGLPANILGLKDRGRILKGHKADIVIIDPDIIASNATWENWNTPPSGIVSVILNGSIVVQQGVLQGGGFGRVLRKR